MKITLLLLLAMAAFAQAETKVVLPDYARFADNRPDFLVETTIPGDFHTLEGIVAALLLLADQATNEDLSSPFLPYANSDRELKPLAYYYRGARQEDGNVILSFSGDAMRYLNHAIAMQQNIKGAIEGTVRLHFPETKEIQYEVDGEIVTEWDA